MKSERGKTVLVRKCRECGQEKLVSASIATHRKHEYFVCNQCIKDILASEKEPE